MVMIGDGQVSMGDTVLKPNAKKVRRIGGGKVLAGFAGQTPSPPSSRRVALARSRLRHQPLSLRRDRGRFHALGAPGDKAGRAPWAAAARQCGARQGLEDGEIPPQPQR